MPRTVVRIKPVGLLGPGDNNRAMIPATKPTIMIHRNTAHVSPSFLKTWHSKSRTAEITAGPTTRFRRQPPIRRQMVDDAGQILAEAREQFVTGQPALRHQAIDLIGAERAGEIARCDLLVRARTDPGVGGVAMAALLKLVEQVAQSAAEDAAGSAAGEQAAQSALQKIAEAAPPGKPAFTVLVGVGAGVAGLASRWLPPRCLTAL